ncbi:MAG: hypothetical protein PHE83_11425 [Opitutaceae bacterium]|nr:hypothetical protein [Opitutaceae bacterium]
MPKVMISLLRPGDERACRIFQAAFQAEPSKFEYALDWTSFQIDTETGATIRGNFDASNRGFALVLLVGDEQVFDAGGYIAEHQPIQFGVRVKSLYIGLFFEPDDVVY